MRKIKLNIGCGNIKLPGWINVDQKPNDPDIVLGDVCEGLEFAAESVDEILLDNVIEHVENIPSAIEEVARLLKPGGVAWIVTPHFTSLDSWRDPTHRWHLSCQSLDYVMGEKHSHLKSPGLIVSSIALSFSGGLGLLSRLIYSVSPLFWEKNLCFVFRARTLIFKLRKV